jgi:hypothetical protein
MELPSSPNCSFDPSDLDLTKSNNVTSGDASPKITSSSSSNNSDNLVKDINSGPTRTLRIKADGSDLLLKCEEFGDLLYPEGYWKEEGYENVTYIFEKDALRAYEELSKTHEVSPPINAEFKKSTLPRKHQQWPWKLRVSGVTASLKNSDLEKYIGGDIKQIDIYRQSETADVYYESIAEWNQAKKIHVRTFKKGRATYRLTLKEAWEPQTDLNYTKIILKSWKGWAMAHDEVEVAFYKAFRLKVSAITLPRNKNEEQQTFAFVYIPTPVYLARFKEKLRNNGFITIKIERPTDAASVDWKVMLAKETETPTPEKRQATKSPEQSPEQEPKPNPGGNKPKSTQKKLNLENRDKDYSNKPTISNTTNQQHETPSQDKLLLTPTNSPIQQQAKDYVLHKPQLMPQPSMQMALQGPQAYNQQWNGSNPYLPPNQHQYYPWMQMWPPNLPPPNSKPTPQPTNQFSYPFFTPYQGPWSQ